MITTEGRTREGFFTILFDGVTPDEETLMTTIAWWEPFCPRYGLTILFHTLIRARERGRRVRVQSVEPDEEFDRWRRSLAVEDDSDEAAITLVYHGTRAPKGAPHWVAVLDEGDDDARVLDFADGSRGCGQIFTVARDAIDVPVHLHGAVWAHSLPFSNAVRHARCSCTSVWSTPSLAASPGARALRAEMDWLLDRWENVERQPEARFSALSAAFRDVVAELADDDDDDDDDETSAVDDPDAAAAWSWLRSLTDAAAVPADAPITEAVHARPKVKLAEVLAQAGLEVPNSVTGGRAGAPGAERSKPRHDPLEFWSSPLSATPPGRRGPVEDRSAISEPWVPPHWAMSCRPDPGAVRAWTAVKAGRPLASLVTDPAPLLESMVAPLSAGDAKRVIKMLRPRSREVLARAGISELTGIRVRDLMSVRGVGPSTVADVVVNWILRDHPRMEARSLRRQDWRAGATLCAELGYAGRVRLGEIFHGDPEDVVRLLLLPVVPFEALAESSCMYLSEVVELLIDPRSVRMRVIASIAAARDVFPKLTTLIRDTPPRSTPKNVGPDYVDAFPLPPANGASSPIDRIRDNMRQALVSLLDFASRPAPDLKRAPGITRQPVDGWLRQLAASKLTLKCGVTTPVELAQAFKPIPPTLEAAARAKGVASECFKGFFQRPRSAWMLTLARIAVAADRTDLLDLAEAPTLRIVDDQEDADVGT
ncbi:MAG: hypothetical protein R3B09_34320 [Nannocystaceae bacterium]